MPAEAPQEAAPARVPWWEKNLPARSREVHGIQDFVDALAEAGDALVVVDFYATWCVACRGVFPKVCKLLSERAKSRPHEPVVFLKLNFDDNRDICKAMGVKTLPYFQLYRGAEGRVDQFTATVSKIQRFKDALDAHGAAFCSLAPPPAIEGFEDVVPQIELSGSAQQQVEVDSDGDERVPGDDTPTELHLDGAGMLAATPRPERV